MQNKLPLFVTLVAGVPFQAATERAMSAQGNDLDQVKEDSGIVRFHGNHFASTHAWCTHSPRHLPGANMEYL